MSFKKIMLLASMAMAAVAFAAPAAQATAPEWYHEGTKVGGEAEAKTLHVTGKLSSNVVGSPLVSGPCEVTFKGLAWNENNMADGVITEGSFHTHTCETNFEGCTITPTLQKFPWDVTGVTITPGTEDEGKGLEITPAQFENHYISDEPGDCPVPVSTIMATGTATGYVDAADNKCLDFENHIDAMQTHAPLPTLTVDILGTVCDTTLELK